LKNINIEYPAWFILLCLLLGILYAAVVYYRTSKFDHAPSYLKILLALLRVSAVSIIAFLLLNPVIKSVQEEVRNPIILLAIDQSNSIEMSNDLGNEISTLEKNLSENYDLKTIYFGSNVAENPLDSNNRTETDLNQVINYMYDNYADQNIGSIILASDGISNKGKNPIYNDSKFSAAINTVLLGDTTKQKDLAIQNVFYNKIVYLNDQFEVQVDISSYNLQGKSTKVRLEKKEHGKWKSLDEKSVNIDKIDFYTNLNFTINADESGTIPYRVKVDGLSQESTLDNNVRSFYVEVLDSKKKILILADAPHPDISALRRSVLSHKNYECEVKFASDPVTPEAYQVVIMHNLPSEKHPVSTVLEKIKTKKIPTLYVAGLQTDNAKLNSLEDFVKLSKTTNTSENILPVMNQNFKAFIIDEELKNYFKDLPPLIARFGEYQSTVGAQVLLNQSIKKIATSYPMLAFNEDNGLKTGILIGEGIWKWRIEDFEKNQNFDQTNNLVNKCLQYLAAKDDKRKFKSLVSKNIFKESDNVEFTGQLYNDSYEMINDPDVALTIKDEEGKDFEFVMSKFNNYYTLDAGQFPTGQYSFTSTTLFNGEKLSSGGKFSVEASEIENSNLVARHDILNAISKKYGGKSYFPNQISELENDILNAKSIKPVVYASSTTSSLLNHKWIFWLILALLSLEWFLRRYFGKY